MGTPVLTALLSAALAGIDGTAVDLQASGRAETSASAFARDGGAPRQLAATDVLPRLALSLDRRTLRLALGYEPQLRVSRDLDFGQTHADLAHGAVARAGWELSPSWRATGDARAVVRLVDLMAPGGGNLGRLFELRARAATVRFFDTAASAGIEGHPTRRVTVGSSVGVDSSRGLGADGLAAMPAMRELRVAGTVAREQTIKDVLRLELGWAEAAFDGGRTASLATAGAGWAHAVARTVRLRLTGTASDARQTDGAPRTIPGGAAELDATPAFLGRPLHATAALRAGAAFDRFSAGVEQRIGADGSVSWEPVPRWSVGALAAAGRVRERGGYLASRGELRAGWRSSRRLTFLAGVWTEWTRDARVAPVANTAYWGTSLAVELAPAPR